MKLKIYILIILFSWTTVAVFSQNKMAKVSGKVIGENRQAIPLVNISIKGKAGGTSTDDHGNYSIELTPNKNITLIFSFIGYKSEETNLKMRAGQEKVVNITLLQSAKQLSDVIVEDKEVRKTTLTRIDPQSALVIPTASGGIEALVKTMPGVSSNLHTHEWVKHGTCYSTDANIYYEDAVSLTEQFNASKVGQFFQKHMGQRVTLQQVRALFDRSFGQGTGKRVEMKCKKGLITELWLHLGSGSDDLATLLKRGKQTRSYCTGGRMDKAGFNG